MSKKHNLIEDAQEIDFNEEYKTNSIDQLKKIKIKLGNIIKAIDNFKNKIEKINNCCSNFIKEIECCIVWLKGVNNYNETKEENTKIHNDFVKKIHDKFENCNKLVKEMDKEDYMNKIYNLNYEIFKTIKDIIDLKFYPPKCENINNSIINFTLDSFESIGDPNYNNATTESLNYSANFYGDSQDNQLISNGQNDNNINEINNNNIKSFNIILGDNIQNEEDNKKEGNSILICSDCKLNTAIYKCYSHCKDIFCEGCSKFIMDNEQLSEHKLKKIEDKEINKETAKELFLKDFIKFIKYYLLKCNYLLNLENSDFNFPTIEDINDNNFQSQTIYLNKINEICNNIKYVQENDLMINGRLISSLESVFGNKKLHISNDNIDNDDDFVSDENCTKEELEFDGIKHNLIYFITVIGNEKIVVKKEYSGVIISRIANSLLIDKNNIFVLLNDKIDNFVKSKNFEELPYNQIQLENSIFNFKDIKIFKILIDQFLCGECKIPKIYFDYKGNCLNPNLSNNIKRGTEIYDPPYGWKAIGLNIEGKYDNNDWLENKSTSSEWAIAYHGISQKNSEEKNKKIIKYIITKNGIKNAVSKMKSNSNDIRNIGQKIREGIYLSPKIKTAEKYTGIIPFNNKRYKVLFMAKVFIKGIREPENTNFWVLDEKNIRIYRILFKEISF